MNKAVPSTKLKGDLLLELKIVKDEIVIEQAKKEKIQTESESIQNALTKRKTEMKKIETEHLNYIEEIDAKIAEKTLKKKELDVEISSRQKTIVDLDGDISEMKNDFNNEKEEKEIIISSLSDKIKDKNETIIELNATIDKLNLSISELSKKIDRQFVNLEGVKTDLASRLRFVRESEAKLERDNADYERRMSELRVFAGRLRKKYGKKLEGKYKLAVNLE